MRDYGSMIEFREARREDASILRHMLYLAADWRREKRSFEQTVSARSISLYLDRWGRPGDGGVVATLDRSAVGAAWFRLFPDDEPGYGFIDHATPEVSIAVAEEHRGRGIGGELLDRAALLASSEGFR